jgi:hypothetical protein
VIMPDLPLGLVVSLLSISFGAGSAWFLVKQVRKDVNGVGQRTRNIEDYLKETVPEDHRKRLTDLMRVK